MIIRPRTLMRLVAAALASLAAFAALPALAQSTAGEIRRIDLAQQKVTLRHDNIASLDMPAMTMVFRVSDQTLLDGLKVGDKVRFDAEQRDGQLVVTRIAPAM